MRILFRQCCVSSAVWLIAVRVEDYAEEFHYQIRLLRCGSSRLRGQGYDGVR